jgi:hypothetical protein
MIIEYNGVRYHAKSITDFSSPFVKDPETKFNKDVLKVKLAQDKGFHTFVVWSDDDLPLNFNKILDYAKNELN